jgi:hypothetical protein
LGSQSVVVDVRIPAAITHINCCFLAHDGGLYVSESQRHKACSAKRSPASQRRVVRFDRARFNRITEAVKLTLFLRHAKKLKGVPKNSQVVRGDVLHSVLQARDVTQRSL